MILSRRRDGLDGHLTPCFRSKVSARALLSCLTTMKDVYPTNDHSLFIRLTVYLINHLSIYQSIYQVSAGALPAQRSVWSRCVV